MFIAFFGDTHGNIETMYDLALDWETRTNIKLDLVVQVGDFGFWLSDQTVDAMTRKHAEKTNEKLKAEGQKQRLITGDYPDYVLKEKTVPIKTLVIRGNHEDQEYLMAMERQLEYKYPEDYLTKTIELVPNLFYLPDGHVVDIEGIKFGALGGNFSYKTWNNWDYWDAARNKRLRYGEKRRLNHFTRDRAEALRRQEMDILLFHDAPTDMQLVGATGIQLPTDEMTEKVYNQFGCPHLKELILDINPQYVFCGHWHQYRKAKFGKTTCTVLNATRIPPTADCMEVIEI